ncbi:MAG TPA: aldo/keto reductase [Pseudolabrys sp.]|nr:aldo/keto reductase [Pseudolabrys sp.]
MNKRTPNRREFGELCVGASLSGAGIMSAALQSASALDLVGAARTVKFSDGTVVPALGQGSANLGRGKRPEAAEAEAMRTGLSLGMTLIDTAELYGSEEFIGRVIAGQRSRVFLVSKVWQTHVAGDGIARACQASLTRLGTDYLDLYLLHWPNGVENLSEVVTAFEKLRSAGKIRAWGVSNFKVSQMENLLRIPRGDRCTTNQVPYSLGDRAIERDLLPWCKRHDMPIMAYSPLGGAKSSLLRDPAVTRIAAAHGCSPAAVALAWAIRGGNVIAIPESGSAEHVKENAVAFSLNLTPQDLEALDSAHPPPRRS